MQGQFMSQWHHSRTTQSCGVAGREAGGGGIHTTSQAHLHRFYPGSLRSQALLRSRTPALCGSPFLAPPRSPRPSSGRPACTRQPSEHRAPTDAVSMSSNAALRTRTECPLLPTCRPERTHQAAARSCSLHTTVPLITGLPRRCVVCYHVCRCALVLLLCVLCAVVQFWSCASM